MMRQARSALINIGLLATPLGQTARGGTAPGDILMMKNAHTLMEHGRITQVGAGQPDGQALQQYEIVDAKGALVTPGLVDAHSHIGLGAGGAVDRATAEQQAITDRDSGVLLIRDAGAPVDTHWVDDRADLPRIIRAGRHIARPGRYIRNFAVEVEPTELVAEVERQALAGDGWVKLVGDWIDRTAGDLRPLWPADDARRAIARVHELGARVTAHCFAEQSVTELVAAGIDCIEHGTGMSAEVIEQMAAQGTVVPLSLTHI